MSAITKLGGLTFSPGESWTVVHTFNPAISDSATVKLRLSTLTITGVVAPGGGSVTFSLTSSQTGTLLEFHLYDAQIQIDDVATPVSFETGENFLGFSADPDPAGAVISLTAGSGISVSPDPITSTGTITATGTVAATLGGMTNVAASADSATANQLLQYNSTSSSWGPVDHSTIPAPGSAVTMPYKAYSPAQSALATVKRRSWNVATGGSSGGAAELIASGVEFVVRYGGYWQQNSDSLKQGLQGEWIEVDSGGALDYNRSTHPASASDGYFIWVDYVETT